MNAGASGLSSWWAKLPVAGRFAVVAAPVVVVLIIAVSMSHPFRDDRSYGYGRESAIAAQAFYSTYLQVGGQASDEARRDACYRMVTRNEPEGIVLDDAMAGCLAAL